MRGLLLLLCELREEGGIEMRCWRGRWSVSGWCILRLREGLLPRREIRRVTLLLLLWTLEIVLVSAPAPAPAAAILYAVVSAILLPAAAASSTSTSTSTTSSSLWAVSPLISRLRRWHSRLRRWRRRRVKDIIRHGDRTVRTRVLWQSQR